MSQLDLSKEAADETRPLMPEAGYVHRARLDCESCKGKGLIEGVTCAWCDGDGWYMVGCGGQVKRDDYWHFASCARCGGTVPSRETSKEVQPSSS